jgi:hypothetical protein
MMSLRLLRHGRQLRSRLTRELATCQGQERSYDAIKAASVKPPTLFYIGILYRLYLGVHQKRALNDDSTV